MAPRYPLRLPSGPDPGKKKRRAVAGPARRFVRECVAWSQPLALRLAAAFLAGALRVAVVLERNGVGARRRSGVLPITSMRPPRLRKAAMSSAMDSCDMLFAATGLDGVRAMSLLLKGAEKAA